MPPKPRSTTACSCIADLTSQPPRHLPQLQTNSPFSNSPPLSSYLQSRRVKSPSCQTSRTPKAQATRPLPNLLLWLLDLKDRPSSEAKLPRKLGEVLRHREALQTEACNGGGHSRLRAPSPFLHAPRSAVVPHPRLPPPPQLPEERHHNCTPPSARSKPSSLTA